MRTVQVILTATLLLFALDVDAGKDPIDATGSWDGPMSYKLKVAKMGKRTAESTDYASVSDHNAFLPYRWSISFGGGSWHHRGRYGSSIRLVWDRVNDISIGQRVAVLARSKGHPDLGEPGEQIFIELTKGKGTARFKKGQLAFKNTVKFVVTSSLHPGESWKGSMKIKQSMWPD